MKLALVVITTLSVVGGSAGQYLYFTNLLFRTYLDHFIQLRNIPDPFEVPNITNSLYIPSMIGAIDVESTLTDSVITGSSGIQFTSQFDLPNGFEFRLEVPALNLTSSHAVTTMNFTSSAPPYETERWVLDGESYLDAKDLVVVVQGTFETVENVGLQVRDLDLTLSIDHGNYSVERCTHFTEADVDGVPCSRMMELNWGELVMDEWTQILEDTEGPVVGEVYFEGQMQTYVNCYLSDDRVDPEVCQYVGANKESLSSLLQKAVGHEFAARRKY